MPGVSGELRATVKSNDFQAYSDGPGPLRDIEVHLYENSASLDHAEVEAVLSAGHTLALVHAPAGEVFGGAVAAVTSLAEPAALVAVTMWPISSGSQKFRTSVTIVPESPPSGCLFTSDETGVQEEEQVVQPAWTDENIMGLLAEHVSLEPVTDSNLLPPQGAKWATVSYNWPWQGQLLQNFWQENNGNSQCLSSQNTQTFYVYYANGAQGQTPYYVILALQNGLAQPAIGSSGLCDNSPNERIFVLASNLASLDPTTCPPGTARVANSPASTRQSPVTSEVEVSMMLEVNQSGGQIGTPFTAASSVVVPNEDWGVMLTSTQGGTSNEAAVEYYNVTGWDASSTESFAIWWAQMYDGNDDVIGLDSQCQTSAALNAMAAWTVPQNSGNAGPLSVQFSYRNSVSAVGFANRKGSGNGHHQMVGWSGVYDVFLPGWDLVALTGSGS